MRDRLLGTLTLAAGLLALNACGNPHSSSSDAGPAENLDAGPNGSSDAGPNSNSDAGPDGGSDAGSTIVHGTPASTDTCQAAEAAPAPSTPFPFPPVKSSGDPVIAMPDVVNITFATETEGPQLADFAANLTSTPCYWDAIRSGYCDTSDSTCVSDGPAGIQVELFTAPATSYTDPSAGGGTLQTFLQGLITAGTVPAPNSNTIYELYFPAGTTITMDGAQSCQDFDGYHSSMVVNGTTVFYTVIPECAPPTMTPRITLLQNTTITASHETIETVTDGNTAGNGGWYLDVQNSESTWGWSDIQGGEVADLCVDPFLLGLDEFTENGYTVQRIWSLANAAAGKNPCVPIPTGEVYFNVYPEKTALVMDVGSSQTITLHALADGTMSAWTLLAQDWTDYTGQTTYLSFQLQGAASNGSLQVQSGDAVSLTVTLTADPSSTANKEADGVLVSANAATDADVTAAHFWPFVVITTDQAALWGATEQ